MSIANLIRSDLREFKPYSSARDEATLGKIWLNANESPFACELQNGLLLNRYPEKQPLKLMNLIAKLFNVNKNQIVISRGSDEVIDLLTRLFCRAGEDSIMICSPTFGMYAVCAKIQGAKIIDIPLIKTNGFQLDLSKILANLNTNTKLIFLCSPNNPTGNLLNKDDLLFLCEKMRSQCIIVVDEAYIDFSDSESLAQYINSYDNLVILRTFSKAYGLAGARCGVLLAQPELAEWILKLIPPYPLSSLTVEILLQILTDNLSEIHQQIETIKSERIRIYDTLLKIPEITHVWPSDANFLLVETTDSHKFMTICAENGVILRDMNNRTGLENCVRISIGLPDENNQLLKILKSVLV